MAKMILIEENEQINAHIEIQEHKFPIYKATYYRNGRDIKTDLELIKDLSSMWIVSEYNKNRAD